MLKKYLTSQEAKKELKVQDCDLAHIRNSSKLQFKKKGNSCFYLVEFIEIQKKNMAKKTERDATRHLNNEKLK